jgi:site-specific recombinase XerD
MNEVKTNLPTICIDYLDYYKYNLNKSDNTINAYARDLKLFADYFKITDNTEVKSLGDITLRDLYKFQASQSSNKSASTVARLTATIKSFYKYLSRFNHIDKNVTSDLEQPKLGERLPKFLNEKETIKLLDTVDKLNTRQPDRDFAILMTFLSTGIRLSELVNINTSDIKDGQLIVTGKGNKQRYIPLSVECQRAIKEYLRNKKYFDGDALFTTERNNRVQANPVGAIVKQYLVKMGKGNLSVHKLRHTAATTWLKNGTDIIKIKELLGHSNISTTEIYTHVNPEGLVEVVNNTGLKGYKRKSKTM